MRKWFKQLISGKPHFIIGAHNPDGPYMLRWYLFPRNHFLNLYLHKFLRDDEDRALHDHPWWFISVMLRGSYWEIMPVPGDSAGWVRRDAPSVAFRRAEHKHRVVLLKSGPKGQPQPCWTLVLTGRKKRTWGFWCPRGFVPWQEFTAADKPGEVGPGCD